MDRRDPCRKNLFGKERRSFLSTQPTETLIIYSDNRTKRSLTSTLLFAFNIPPCLDPELTPKETTTPLPVDPTRAAVPPTTVSPKRSAFEKFCSIYVLDFNLTFDVSLFEFVHARLQQQRLLLLLQRQRFVLLQQRFGKQHLHLSFWQRH